VGRHDDLSGRRDVSQDATQLMDRIRVQVRFRLLDRQHEIAAERAAF
jgi:hypothetical protein